MPGSARSARHAFSHACPAPGWARAPDARFPGGESARLTLGTRGGRRRMAPPAPRVSGGPPAPPPTPRAGPRRARARPPLLKRRAPRLLAQAAAPQLVGSTQGRGRAPSGPLAAIPCSRGERRAEVTALPLLRVRAGGPAPGPLLQGHFPERGVVPPPAARRRPRAGAEARARGVAPHGRARRRGALFRRRAPAGLPRGDAAAGRRAAAARGGARGSSLRPAPPRRGDAQEGWRDEQGQWRPRGRGGWAARGRQAGPRAGERRRLCGPGPRRPRTARAARRGRLAAAAAPRARPPPRWGPGRGAELPAGPPLLPEPHLRPGRARSCGRQDGG